MLDFPLLPGGPQPKRTSLGLFCQSKFSEHLSHQGQPLKAEGTLNFRLGVITVTTSILGPGPGVNPTETERGPWGSTDSI